MGIGYSYISDPNFMGQGVDISSDGQVIYGSQRHDGAAGNDSVTQQYIGELPRGPHHGL